MSDEESFRRARVRDLERVIKTIRLMRPRASSRCPGNYCDGSGKALAYDFIDGVEILTKVPCDFCGGKE